MGRFVFPPPYYLVNWTTTYVGFVIDGRVSSLVIRICLHHNAANAVSMLGQRRRQWTSIKPALGQWLVFAGNMILFNQKTQNICITFIQRRPNVFDVGPTLYSTLGQHCINVIQIFCVCWAIDQLSLQSHKEIAVYMFCKWLPSEYSVV